MFLKKKKILAIIPARYGSKRIQNKNLKTFNSKPLIYWTIKASQKSKFISKTLVSSDSEIILKKAKNLNVDFCIKRPKKLSNDKADSWSVVRHALKVLKKEKLDFEFIVLLQPTSPLRSHNHIDQCLTKFKKEYTGIISINRTLKPLEWQTNLYQKKKFKFFKSGILKFRKNKRKNYTYVINGAIYAFKTKEIFKKNFLFKNSVSTYEMDVESSIDIDTNLEFQVAEFLKKSEKFSSKRKT